MPIMHSIIFIQQLCVGYLWVAGRAGEERGRERPLRHPQPHAPQDLYRATQGDAGVCVCVSEVYVWIVVH